MSRQFMNDGFRNAPEEKNGGRYVPKVVNPQLLDAGARTGSLERFSDIPDVHLLAGEVHVAAGGSSTRFSVDFVGQSTNGSVGSGYE